MNLQSLIAAERRTEARRLAIAAALAAAVTAASVLLLGLSGWFITAAAIAGASGIAAAQAFNYMLPSAAIRLLAIVRTAARYGERLASHGAAFAALARIRPMLFAAIAAAPPQQSLALGRGDATARLIGDVDAVENHFIRRSGPWGVAAALVSGTALTLIAGILPALATAAWLALLLLAADRIARRLEAPCRAAQQAMADLREAIATLGEASPELRCFGLESWAADHIAARSLALADAQRAQAGVAAAIEWLHATAIGLSAATALLLSIDAGAPLAALAALTAAMTLDGAGPVLRAMTERGRLHEAQQRLDTLLANAAASPAHPRMDVQSLRLGRVEVHAGARVALVGPSGIGKTSLVETLLGLRPATGSDVAVNGGDIKESLYAALRPNFAWVPQDAMLISGSVRENLLLAHPDASDAMLWSALRDAALDARINALPDGLDSWIGDNGARLSGGERRRLALARAYLSDAPWLLLDEPTEGLDAATEEHVAAALERRLAATGQGLILVSHRPRLSRLCHNIIDMSQEGQRAAA